MATTTKIKGQHWNATHSLWCTPVTRGDGVLLALFYHETPETSELLARLFIQAGQRLAKEAEENEPTAT